MDCLNRREKYRDMDAEVIHHLQAFGSCAPFEKEYIRKDGSRIPVMLGCAMPSPEAGEGVAFMLDIRDRRQAEMTQKILAEAGSILVSSLDYRTTLNSIAQLLVPTLADLCFFDLILSDGSMQRVASYHSDQEKAEWFTQIQEFAPIPNDARHPVNQVLQSRKGQIDAIDAAWIRAIAQTPKHQHMIELCCLTTLITVPLIARNRTLGALTLALTYDSHRTYTEKDLAIAEQLATRVSLALDNSRLYQQAQEANRIKDEFLAVLSHELRSP